MSIKLNPACEHCGADDFNVRDVRYVYRIAQDSDTVTGAPIQYVTARLCIWIQCVACQTILEYELRNMYPNQFDHPKEEPNWHWRE